MSADRWAATDEEVDRANRIVRDVFEMRYGYPPDLDGRGFAGRDDARRLRELRRTGWPLPAHSRPKRTGITSNG